MDQHSVKEKDPFLRLWSHECMRVFHDRLVDDHDRQWFMNLLQETVKASFNMDISLSAQNPILFGNFSDPKSVQKPYIEMNDRLALAKHMAEYLEDYNMTSSKPMNLVLFSSAIEHVARISRVINQPNGNALLVGVGGSGRKSLTALAVFIADYKLFQVF